LIPSLLSRSQICESAWNRLIGQSLQSVAYGFSFYLDLVCEDWKALVWPSDHQYEIVMPLPVRRKMCKQIVYQPFFCQYLGIFSRSVLSAEQAEVFLRCFSSHFSYVSAYHFHPDNYRLLSGISHSFTELNFVTRTTYWLDFTQDYECIAAGYSRDRRTNLKRGIRANWEVIESSNIHPLISLFVQNHAPKIAGGVDPNAYNVLEATFETMQSIGGAELWYAHRNGVIHAGILIINYSGVSIYLFNAADPIGRRDGARTFLLDQYFRTFTTCSSIFDFESPEIPSIANFYRSFGSVETPYLKISKNQLVPPLRQIQNFRKRLAN
jgi:hypothetical protein